MKYLFYLFVFFFVFGCVSVETVKETVSKGKELQVSFFNDTVFAIDILEDNPDSLFPVLHIEPQKTKTFTKTLHLEDEISTFFYAKFQIPIEKKLIPVIDYRVYRIETKNGLNQKISITTDGASIKQTPYYVVLKNLTSKGIEVCNSSSKDLYFSMDNNKSASPKKSIVYSSKDRSFYTSHDKVSMKILYNGSSLPFFISSLKPGYVYTYEFNGKDAVKVDERPILKVGEPLWMQEDASLAIEKILKDDGLYYLAGNKRVLDSYGNAYSCPYMRCIDDANNLKWQTEEKSIDGYIQDAVLLEDGSILSCGQSLIKEENVGSLWLYSRDGVLQGSKNYSDFQVITKMAVMGDDVALSGFDTEGKLKLSKVSIANNTISATKKLVAPLSNEIIESTSSLSLLYETASKTLFLCCNLTDEYERTLPSKLFAIKENGKMEEISLGDKIASVVALLQSADGTIYAGGESTLDEKTESVVLKIVADKDGSVRTSSLFYQGKVPFSYITSMTLDEDSKTLTVGGVCKAKKSSGLAGIPFIASFDIISGNELIYREYKSSKKQIVRSFVPALDYGFIACFSSVIQDDGEFESYGQSMWGRMSATGMMKD